MDVPFIKKALEVFNVLLDDEETEIYEGQLKWLLLKMSTVKKAREAGLILAKDEAKECARKLLKNGVAISTIAFATALTEEEILSLQDESPLFGKIL